MQWGTNLPRPSADTFAAIPATVVRLLTGAPGGLPQSLLGEGAPEHADRVAVVLLDAFGMRFVRRHADHPLLRRLHVAPVVSQFPSTTTAHVTTMHTGLPVGVHGLYEWNVLEPSLQRIVTPLRATYAGDPEGDALVRDGFDLAALLPDVPRFYERLGVPCWVFQPARFSPSSFDRVAVRGAEMRPYEQLEA